MATGLSASEDTVRAINVQLADTPKTTAVTLVGARGDLCDSLPKRAHARIERVDDDAICLAGRVLMDDRRVHAVVAHP